jgi:hypothetical protein
MNKVCRGEIFPTPHLKNDFCGKSRCVLRAATFSRHPPKRWNASFERHLNDKALERIVAGSVNNIREERSQFSNSVLAVPAPTFHYR